MAIKTDKYGYILKQKETQKDTVRYHKADLMLMTTFQLREICREEKIIQGAVNPMDKEELIRVILRYRGADEYFLIRTERQEGLDALNRVLEKSEIRERKDIRLECSSKIVIYEGLAVGFYDELTVPYVAGLAGTNALVVGGDGRICTILNVEEHGGRKDVLYLTKQAELSGSESMVKNYCLYCMDRRNSEMLYRIYYGNADYIPEHLEVYRIPLLDFEVRKPVPLSMPMAMDFGSSNTTAGIYLENGYKHAVFYDPASQGEASNLLPSVVGVLSMEGGQPEFLYGYDAVNLAQSSYIDEGFCVFYDIKRWIVDHEKMEEITDRQGRRGFLSRKEILKAFFHYVIDTVKNQFKCQITEVHISSPVKQKAQFQKLFSEILPDYAIETQNMIDEGVSVLYNTIAEMIQKGSIRNGVEYKALILDCGGGTTDLCSCSFRIWDKRVAYRIEIDTSYENGDTDFGGNNLTYRIMQLLKILLVNRLYPGVLEDGKKILSDYDMDVFRYVDQYGTGELYAELEKNYEAAEKWIPTRFGEFEHQSRLEYYKVKNNFYFLFRLAETIKKEFYDHTGILRIAVASKPVRENATTWIPAEKWKFAVYGEKGLEVLKEFPEIDISIFDIELLLKGDIYGVIHRFMERMYEEDVLEEYSLIKLTGQSCKIDVFRDALKEYVPGKTIQFKHRRRENGNDHELKMTCVDGALKFLKDKKYGFADVVIHTKEPALPYRITAFTHSGQEITLIHRLKRSCRSGMISRNMEDLTLKLYLKDCDGMERYQYVCHSSLGDFEQREYEAIAEKYGEHIMQADTDDIVENEVRFFVWARPEEWAFSVVPVYRREEKLYLGKEEEFYFENDGWVQNFYDGMK